ncbi:hypothetical protein IWX46DRAFT_583074 [Phyllosticta citricarpa]|uniref:Uncharacterized protein n=1 Tax=Phyllosticta citricarpa TaxID=55181 RepID=A0ABR1LV58_9PEZI
MPHLPPRSAWRHPALPRPAAAAARKGGEAKNGQSGNMSGKYWRKLTSAANCLRQAGRQAGRRTGGRSTAQQQHQHQQHWAILQREAKRPAQEKMALPTPTPSDLIDIICKRTDDESQRRTDGLDNDEMLMARRCTAAGFLSLNRDGRVDGRAPRRAGGRAGGRNQRRQVERTGGRERGGKREAGGGKRGTGNGTNGSNH